MEFSNQFDIQNSIDSVHHTSNYALYPILKVLNIFTENFCIAELSKILYLINLNQATIYKSQKYFHSIKLRKFIQISRTITVHFVLSVHLSVSEI